MGGQNLLILHCKVVLPLGLDDCLPQVLKSCPSRPRSAQIDNAVHLLIGEISYFLKEKYHWKKAAFVMKNVIVI